MKITFVYPKGKILFSKSRYPPLGLGYLISLSKKMGFDVELIDYQTLEEPEYESRVRNIRADILGISSEIIQLKEVWRILQCNSQVPIKLIGGSGPTSVPLSYLEKHPYFDIAFIGEGENAFTEIMETILKGTFSLKAVKTPGVIVNEGGRLRATGHGILVSSLDEIPFPDREELNIKRYLELWKESQGSSSTSMMTTRGCPYACIFCDRSITGLKYRSRSPGNVVDEFEQIHTRYGPDDIYLFDDTATIEAGRMIAVCKEILSRGIRQNWSLQSRVNTFSEDLAKNLSAAGCNEVLFGVESGSEKILKFLDKRITPGQAEKAFALCHKHGIKPGAYFIVGVPGETKKDIEATKSLIYKIKPHLINVTYLTPLPNTRLYDYAIKQGYEIDIDKIDYDRKPFFIRHLKGSPRESLKEVYDFYREKVNPDFEPYFVNEQYKESEVQK